MEDSTKNHSMSGLNPPEDVSGEDKSTGINSHCCTAFDVPVSPLHGDAAMWGRLADNDGKLEIATNKRVSPLAALAKVRVMEIAPSKQASMLEVAADK